MEQKRSLRDWSWMLTGMGVGVFLGLLIPSLPISDWKVFGGWALGFCLFAASEVMARLHERRTRISEDET